jgi:hypothetical protein
MKHEDNSAGVDALMSNADAFDAAVERIAAMSGKEVESNLLRMGIQPARELPARLREVLAETCALEKELQALELWPHQLIPAAIKNIIAECRNHSRSRTTYFKYFGRKFYKQLLSVLISARFSAHNLLRNKTACLLAFYFKRESSVLTFSIPILSITLLSFYLMGNGFLQPNNKTEKDIPNNPPTTAASASPSRVVLAADYPPDERPVEGCTSIGSTVQLVANATDPDGDTLLYTWSTTGGRIEGDGANVTWDLSGVQPGTYTASVEVDDDCGCIAFSSTTVTVERCTCEALPIPPTPKPTVAPTPEPTGSLRRRSRRR